MHDETLGALVLNDSELTLTLGADFGAVKLTVQLEGASPAEAMDTARSVVATLLSRLARARDELAAAFLPVVNGGYLETGEAPLSREEFLRRAGLRAVRADRDGNTSFHFDDDDMLWGHRVVVDCNREGSHWRASVFG